MLLAVDVGNTQTHVGVFSGENLIAEWRISTNSSRTADELALTFNELLSLKDLVFSEELSGVIISSVVPAATASLRKMVGSYFPFDPVVVGPGIKTGMPILTENPKEVGADRVVNSLAAFTKFGGPLIVVDFGTATTFDAISVRGEYLGGAIAPGLEVSAAALWNSADQLTRVELASPGSAIGKSTPDSVRSGLVLGAAAMVDGMVDLMGKELQTGEPAADASPGDILPAVVATGGLARLVLEHCKTKIYHEPELTLTGLRILYERNVETGA